MRYILFFLIPLFLFGASVVSDAYAVYDSDTTQYIFPQKESFDLNRAEAIEKGVMQQYTREFGFWLDQKFYLIFASQNNQIANALSTQIPLNEIFLYGAGVLNYDRFASISWRKTLLVHESAHNFQLNPKTGTLAKIAHAIGGNIPIISPLFLPMFPVPNTTIDRFILEGNAVLNESRFGNGGRLYSGYALAQTVALAHAGGITPAAMVNRTLRFPYGEKFYLAGGFFQQFLARRYGIRRVNGYFKAYAAQTLPLFGDRVFRKQYGKDFVSLLDEFAQEVRTQHRAFRRTKGQVIACSQIDAPLTKQNGEVLALVGDRRSAPQVLSYHTRDGSVHTQSGGWFTGKALRIDGRIYTRASAVVHPGAIKVGLFDRNGYLRNQSAGKAVQGRLSDGRWVYLDAAHSWEEPQLYAGQQRFGTVNSSVLVRGDHLYYFRQYGRQRVLYRDHTPLVRIDGYDAHPVDTDANGCVYFIAPSRHGSTAYRTCKGAIERVVPGDDVIDLKWIGSHQALVRTLGADGYTLQRIRLHPRRATVPRMSLQVAEAKSKHATGSLSHASARSYDPLAQLAYVGLRSRSSWSASSGYALSLSAHWSDPLWWNALAFSMRYTRDRTLLSAEYQNKAHAIAYGGSITRVIKHAGGDNADYRDWGYSAYLKWPFLARGYWRGSMRLSYDKLYDEPQRQPWTASIEIVRRQQFGVSKYPNSLHTFSAFGARDRGTTMWGGSYRWIHQLADQTFASARGQYLRADAANQREHRGIKVGDISSAQTDRAMLTIPTLDQTEYVRKAAMFEAGLYRVFETGWYSYRWPLSFMRYALYGKQRWYALTLSNGKTDRIRESIAGIEADLLLQHRYVVPFNIELQYNGEAKQKRRVRIRAEYRF
jgi:hypothetical protein